MIFKYTKKDNLNIKLNNFFDILYWVNNKFINSGIFCGHGTYNYLNEAKYLILSSLNKEPNKKIFNFKIKDNEKNIIIKNTIKRIKKKIPVSYITNKSWYQGLNLYINRKVVIPRSPIGEILYNKKNNFINFNSNIKILDLCTGSGCIAILIAKLYPKSEIDAVDISKYSIKVAKYNIKKYNLNNKINLIKSDLFKKLNNNCYDLIIANPPYLNKIDMINLPKEYKYEPRIGLFGGNNGLIYINKIINMSLDYLKNKGILICEIGNNYKYIKKIYSKLNLLWINTYNTKKSIFLIKKK